MTDRITGLAGPDEFGTGAWLARADQPAGIIEIGSDFSGTDLSNEIDLSDTPYGISSIADNSIITIPALIGGTAWPDISTGHALANAFTSDSSPSFKNLDLTGVTAKQQLAIAINDKGVVVGAYGTENDQAAFIDSNGTVTTLALPMTTYAEAAGINDTGTIVGSFADGTIQVGFVGSGSSFTTLSDGGAAVTYAEQINNTGTVVGYFEALNQSTNAFTINGFVESKGVFTTLNDPDGPEGSLITGLNNHGTYTGIYFDSNGGRHGFIESGGTYTTIDDPAADGSGTDLRGINDAGQLVGAYLDTLGTFHGFIDSNGTFTTIDDPRGVGTEVLDINDSGTVVGYYTLSNGETRGFTESGSVTEVSPPSITGARANQATSDAATIKPFAHVVITDSNSGQTETLTVTPSATANGKFSNLGTGSLNATTGVYKVTGTASAVEKALEGLIFTPTAHQVAANDTVTTIFTIKDTDSAGASASNSTSSVVARASATPVVKAPAKDIFNVGTATSITGVSLSETGSTAAETFTVILSDKSGLISATGTGVTGAGTTGLTITGSLAQVNSDLASLTDTDTTDATDTIKIKAKDSFGNSALTSSIALTPLVTHIITFSESAVGTVDPVYTYTDNKVNVIGEIVLDSAQPNSPAVAANTSDTGPVYLDFKDPFTSISFDVDNLDATNGATIEFIGAGGKVLSSLVSTQTGIIPISYSNTAGIYAFEVVNNGTDPAGFTVDTVTFSGSKAPAAAVSSVSIAAASAVKAPSTGTLTAYTFTVTRTGSTTGSSSVGWSVTGSGSNPLVAANLPSGKFPSGKVTFAAGVTSETITVDIDGGFTLQSPETFTVTLLAPNAGTKIETASATGTILATPVISGAVAGQKTTDNTTIHPFAHVAVSDKNSHQTETLTVTPSSVKNGAFSNPGTGSINATTGVFTVTGTAAAVKTAIEGLVFTPTAGQVAAGKTVTTDFTITDTDTAGVSATNTVTSVIVTAVAAKAATIAAVHGTESKIAFLGTTPAGQLTIEPSKDFGLHGGSAAYVGPLLEDFAVGNVIDLKHIASAGLKLAYNAATGDLKITAGSGSIAASLHFQNNSLGAGIFSTEGDKSGGTVLRLLPK